MTKYDVYETGEYKEWLEGQSHKSRRQILNRVLKIEEEGHFGHHKYLKEDIWELKFNDGRRIYYAVDSPKVYPNYLKNRHSDRVKAPAIDRS